MKIQFGHTERGPDDVEAAAFSCLRVSHPELKEKLDAALLKAGNAMGPNRCAFAETLEKITLKSWDSFRPSSDGDVISNKLYLVSQGVECFDSEAASFVGVFATANFHLEISSKSTKVYDPNNLGETVYTFSLRTAEEAAAAVGR